MLVNLIAALAFVSTAWFISVWMTRADIIDAFWGPGFLVVAVTTIAQRESETVDPRRIVLLFLVLVWAMRLGLHLAIRWWNEEHEDRRYAAMRAQGSSLWWLRSLFTVFWLQAVILWVVALPLQLGLSSTATPGAVIFSVGASVWLVGFLFEAVGDYQLTRFRANPQNSDGVLTEDEYAEKDRKHFGRSDTNKDGKVDLAELQAALKALQGVE